MTVEGLQHRAYGTLVDTNTNCHIYLHRFAVVLGADVSPPEHSGSVIYGDNANYRSCGHTYNGYLSLLFYASGASLAYAVMEVRKCKTGKSYIFVETYGETTAPQYPISLWFNSGSEATPNWTRLNGCESGVLPYHESTFKFDEKKGPSYTTAIDNCNECVGGKCISCGNLCQKFTVTASWLLPVTKVYVDTFEVSNPDNKDLSSLIGQKIYLYKWEFNHFLSALRVTETTNNTITVDVDHPSYYEGAQYHPGLGEMECSIYAQIIDAQLHLTGVNGDSPAFGPFTLGNWCDGVLSAHISFRVEARDGNGNLLNLSPCFLYQISEWNPYNSYCYMGSGGKVEGEFTLYFPQDPASIVGRDYIRTQNFYVNLQNSMALGPTSIYVRIELHSLIDAKGNNRVNESNFNVLTKSPAHYMYLRANDTYNSAGWNNRPPTYALNLTGQCQQVNNALVTDEGAFSLKYGNYIAIDYKLDCKTIDINAKTLDIIPYNYFYNVIYTDQNGTNHTIINNTLTDDVNVIYPFDYLNYCITLANSYCSNLCVDYISFGNIDFEDLYKKCGNSLIGKRLRMKYGWINNLPIEGIIVSVRDTHTVRLNNIILNGASENRHVKTLIYDRIQYLRAIGYINSCVIFHGAADAIYVTFTVSNINIKRTRGKDGLYYRPLNEDEIEMPENCIEYLQIHYKSNTFDTATHIVKRVNNPSLSNISGGTFQDCKLNYNNGNYTEIMPSEATSFIVDIIVKLTDYEDTHYEHLINSTVVINNITNCYGEELDGNIVESINLSGHPTSGWPTITFDKIID